MNHRRIRLTHQRDEITLQKAQLILPGAEIGEESPGEGGVPPTAGADPGATRAAAGHRGRHGPRSGWGLWYLWKPEAGVTDRARMNDAGEAGGGGDGDGG